MGASYQRGYRLGQWRDQGSESQLLERPQVCNSPCRDLFACVWVGDLLASLQFDQPVSEKRIAHLYVYVSLVGVRVETVKVLLSCLLVVSCGCIVRVFMCGVFFWGMPSLTIGQMWHQGNAACEGQKKESLRSCSPPDLASV